MRQFLFSRARCQTDCIDDGERVALSVCSGGVSDRVDKLSAVRGEARRHEGNKRSANFHRLAATCVGQIEMQAKAGVVENIGEMLTVRTPGERLDRRPRIV